MKRIFVTIIIAAAILITACAPSQIRYKDNPVTKQELINRIGNPDDVIQTEVGNEKLIYAYHGFGPTYVYYLVDDGFVVEDGLYRY